MLNWGIIGAGNISGAFAKGLQQTDSGGLVAVASRDAAKARAFADEHAAPGTAVVAHAGSDGYAALLADPTVEAVYIGLPHTEHLHWTVRALRAGKHVLCEKPLGLNHAEAMIAYDESERAGRVLMEAFMYRCIPQTAKLLELLKSGVIGELRHIQTSFCYASTPRAGSRTWEPALAGGGILDVGCYPMSMARLLAGVARGQAFAEPTELQAMGHLHEMGVDAWALATLRFPGDITAQIATAVSLEQEESLRLGGTKGALVVPKPWYGAGAEAGESRIELWVDEALAQTWTITTDRGLYAYEADTFAQAVKTGAVAHPAMSPADSIANLAALDRWRKAIGLVYPKEQAPALTGRNTLAGLPITRRPEANMRYGQVPGLAKPVSRLIMGVDHQESLPYAAALFDDYLERGGNAFDTAWVYDFEGGHCEAILGDWLKARGIRDDIVLIAKSAHTPNCTPEGMRTELAESLERLQTDYADLYVLHRDNPEVPVGEFIDALNEQRSRGRFQAFGGSNWSLARVAEANAYAAKTGQQGFSLVNNQLSLARMQSPIWRGCVSAGDVESRRWLAEQGLALFAWSSQARGFFVDGRSAPNQRDDEELVRCWYSEANFLRLARARELAQRKGCAAINIALAWVLAQGFPAFSLIGPRSIAETASSMRGLDVHLSADELAWLDLTDLGAPA
ncbi:aldo/keto reductase [Roseateles toxinivorans]|uniref:Putative dehydrogenase n=1 Tax=Roseateles toxinivorans TaxID=270368 RepID=A0A4R6QLA4_9BURK|nr:aldo/keto reductase [Roseateles toxinivorans]TDP64137.1 putative dehydrogenase [Roseateles toxinivorans]